MSQEDPKTVKSEPGISLEEAIRFLIRNWAYMAVPAVVTAAFTVLIVYLFIPRSYEASAVLVIAEPRFTSELKPPVLSVQAYQNLLGSDAVIAEARQRLQAKGQLDKSDPLRLGEELETKIFVSRRAEETSLAPMIQLVATGRTPDQAAAMANTWATVFLERIRELTGDSTTTTVRFIDGQYPQTLDRLAHLEDERKIQQNESQQRYNFAANRWEEKISTYKRESIDLLSAYRAETRRLLEEFMSQRTLETRRVQLATMRKAYGDVQAELGRVDLEAKQKNLLLEAARSQLKDTPELVTLRKAMTDDALWQEVNQAPTAPPEWDKLRERALQSEVVNPVHTELTSRLLQLEMEVNALVPRKQQLTEELAAMAEDLKEKEISLRTDEARLEKLQQERDAGLAKLQEEREFQMILFNRGRQQDLDTLKRQGDSELARIERNIAQQKGLFDELMRSYNQAVLAKAQDKTEDIRLGAQAVEPEQATPRKLSLFTLLAGLVGGISGLFYLLIRDSKAKQLGAN